MAESLRPRHRVRLLLAVALCLLFAPLSASAGAPAPVSLRVAVFPFVSFAPFYIAQAEGFFAEQGLEVEFVRFQRHADSLPALLRGDIDADTIFTVGVMNAIGRGENVRVVAARGTLTQNGCPIGGFLVRPGRIEELEGMTTEGLRQLVYGVDRTWLDSYFLQLWLKKRGLDLSDVKTEYVPAYAARLEALRNGSLDVAFFNEPWITTSRQLDAGSLWLAAEDLAPGYPFSIITFGPSLLERTDGAGVRFLRAYLRAVAQYAEGKTPRNVEILANATRLEPELLRTICWPVIPADGKIDAQAIVGYSAWTAAQGLTDRPLSAAEIWAPEFLENALRP